MKTKNDPRHQRRREIVQTLFAYCFQRDQALPKPADGIVQHLTQIDQEIAQAAPEWPIDRINKLDLTVLRLAIFELLIQKTEPPRVIIDEAVELAKEFGSESSGAFVNGVLGNILKKYYDTESKRD